MSLSFFPMLFFSVTKAAMSEDKVALIAGATGIIGHNLAQHLLGPNAVSKWAKVYGISRRKSPFLPEAVHHVSCDLQDQSDAETKLGQLNDVTHVFCAVWLNMTKEEDNIRVNSALIQNLLDGLTCPLKHVVLVTGTKYYTGPFEYLPQIPREALALVETPFKERMPRVPLPNFYYAQEDILFDQAEKRKFTWSESRPCTVIGYAPTSQMNLGTTIAVYASICKYAGLPFTFPGPAEGLDIFTDVTDARLLAEHLEWEAITPAAQNEAFNAVNGDIFRWCFLWREVAKYFGLEAEEHSGNAIDMEEFAIKYASVWDEIVVKHQLKPYKLNEIFQGWFANVILGATTSYMSDMSKSRERGFLQYQSSEKTFLQLFDKLREEKIIP